MCGINIGKRAIVGATATVTKDVSDIALVIGTPASVVGWVSEAGKRLFLDSDGYAFC